MTLPEGYHELTAEELAHRWRKRTLPEYVDEAIAELAEAPEEYASPDAALRHLLDLAWGDLQRARHHALNGVWSMECDSAVHRIAGLTRLVGPISWRAVQVDLILDGIYERIHAAIGTPTPLTDADRTRAREVMERRSR